MGNTEISMNDLNVVQERFCFLSEVVCYRINLLYLLLFGCFLVAAAFTFFIPNIHKKLERSVDL